MPSETTWPSLTTTNEPFVHVSTCAIFQAAYSVSSCAVLMATDLALFQVAGGVVARLLEPEPALPLVAPPWPAAPGASATPPPGTGAFPLTLPAVASPEAVAPAAANAELASADSPQAGKSAKNSANSGKTARIVIKKTAER